LLFAIIVYSLLGAALGAGIDWASSKISRMQWEEARQRQLQGMAAGAGAPGSPGAAGFPPAFYEAGVPGPPGSGERPPPVVAGAPWPPAAVPPSDDATRT